MSFSALSCTEKAKPGDTPAAIDTIIPTLITQVKKCSRLYTAEYKIHKIITHNDEVRAKGKILNHEYDVALPVGERKVAIPVDATIKAYIDFGDFSERNIKRNGRKMEILLPDPGEQNQPRRDKEIRGNDAPELLRCRACQLRAAGP